MYVLELRSPQTPCIRFISHMQPLAGFRPALEQRFDVDRCLPVAYNWRQSSPSLPLARGVNMQLKVRVLVVSSKFAVEYFSLCPPDQDLLGQGLPNPIRLPKGKRRQVRQPPGAWTSSQSSVARVVIGSTRSSSNGSAGGLSPKATVMCGITES